MTTRHPRAVSTTSPEASAGSPCCTSCFKGEKYGQACCEKDTYEDQVTEWVEEEVYYDNGAKGGKGGSTIVRRPVGALGHDSRPCGFLRPLSRARKRGAARTEVT